MRLLYTLLTILTVGIASAQESVLTISQIAHGDNTYTHIKGDDNGAENCFEANAITSVSTLSMSVNGLSVENVYIDGEPFSWTGPGGEALAISFGSWDDYNEIYRNRGSQRPIIDRTTDLLRCDGWSLDASGQWYTNSDFAGYAYNAVVATSGNAPHAPQLVASYTGVAPDLRLIADGGQRIYVGSFSSNEAAVAAVEEAIREHMNPTEIPEEEEETVVDEWTQGGIVGWLPPAGFDSAWSNPAHPGFGYSIDEWTSTRQYAQYNPHLIGHNAYIAIADVSETSGWRTEHIGTYQTNQEAVDASRTYITSRSSTDNYETTAVGSYLIINAGFSAYYVEILTPQGTLVEFRAFSTYMAAEDFARDPASYPARVSFTPSDFDTTTHANPGWLRGVYQGGLAGYTVTAPTRFSEVITSTWTWTDRTGFGHTGSGTFVVPSTSYFIYWNGDRFETLEALRSRYPRGSYTELHSYEQAEIDRIQRNAVEWAIQQINNNAQGINPSS